MALEIPRIDDRSYKDFLAEALARVRVHNPEWNNFNESDPGVTILELFAFMSESLLYRANLIPERNRRKFLTLLGVPMQPAAAARGILTFLNERGPMEAVTVAAGLEVKAGQVPFRTLDGADVLPVEARIYYKKEVQGTSAGGVRDLYTKLYGGEDESEELRFYASTRLEPPVDPANIPSVELAQTLDRSLWIVLLARPKEEPDAVRAKIAGKTLNIGILPAYTETTRVLPPMRTPVQRRQSPLLFELATDQYESGGDLPRYERLRARFQTDILSEPGTVQVQLPGSIALWDLTEPLTAGTGDYPPSLEDTADEERVVTWIRIRLADTSLNAKMGWAGINAVMVTQRARVAGENLGKGTGEPDQSFTLANKPVIPGTAQITVDGALWTETDDLLAAPPEVPLRDRRLPPGAPLPAAAGSKLFLVDRESGLVRFGTGAAGARPPAGSAIRAAYDYGGGTQGNVGIGAISKASALPAGLKVTNPLPTWGGDEPETVAEAERNIPKYLQHRDRLVTEEDFRDIVQRTPGVDIGRREVLPLFHPDLPDVAVPGVVTIMVIPKYDVARPEAPVPDRLFLELVCEQLDLRRLVTTELYVRGPEYVPLAVSVGIEAVPGGDFPAVREAVNAQLKAFLSPLTGGRDAGGWPLEKAVLEKELWAEAARVDGVAYVKDLTLGDANGARQDQISLTGLQLPWLIRVDTQEGDPEPLSQLLGTATAPKSEAEKVKKIKPVPVLPPECPEVNNGRQ